MATAAKPDGSAPATLLGDSKPAGSTDTGGEKSLPGSDSDENKGKPAGDGKPADGAAGTSTVPEKYDLSLPDDSPFNAAFVEGFSTKAKESKLSQEQAKALFDHVHQQFGERMAALQQSELKGGEAYNARVKQWAREAANDKEIGGTNWNANIGLAKRVAAQFFDPELIDFLENTGYGSNPKLIKALVNIGRAMGEDKLVKAAGTSEEKKSKPAEQVMYPSHYDESGKPK